MTVKPTLGKKHVPSSLERNLQTKDFSERVRINQRKLTAELRPHYDFIVCGSGSSGSVVVRIPTKEIVHSDLMAITIGAQRSRAVSC